MATSSQNGNRTVKFSFDQTAEGPVYLVGSFNNWDITATPMKCGRDGCWKCSLKVPPGQYQYRYYANGQWFTDAQNAATVLNQYGDLNNLLQVEPLKSRPAVAAAGKTRSK